MFNEGYAHYISLKAYGLDPEREESKALYNKLREREKILFDKFNKKIKFYLNPGVSEKTKQNLLHESHTGPFWEKWGAMTAAFIFYHLECSIGLDESVKLFEKNPYEYLIKYKELESKNSEFPYISDKFIDFAKKLFKRSYKVS